MLENNLLTLRLVLEIVGLLILTIFFYKNRYQRILKMVIGLAGGILIASIMITSVKMASNVDKTKVVNSLFDTFQSKIID